MPVKKNLKLWMAIKEANLSQRKFSQIVDEEESHISKVVNGWMLIPDEKQEKWARVLGRKPEELFEY